MQYRAVIFDLDGTLVDSLADLADSVNEVLTEYGHPAHPVERYKIMVGDGIRCLVERALPQGSDAALIGRALEKFKAVYERRLLLRTRPYSGVLPLLEALRRRGIPLAVCTNKPCAAAARIVEALFPAGTFCCVLGERPGAPRKPAPDGVLEIAAAMGVDAETVVYVGDSSVDMQTGVNAGMLPVGVLWGFRKRQELEENGARMIVAKPEELLKKVEFVVE